ncbi:MAG: peptide-methionine (R)-S-oxide reductase [Bacteroidetes bacterium]|nr:MAG: peptide-methionine (R)-S-oxide reductase [Bacteroidota bacterium]
MKHLTTALLGLTLATSCSFSQPNKPKTNQATQTTQTTPSTMSTNAPNPVYNREAKDKVNVSEAEWKKMLSPEVYYISRQKGTERPWTSKFEAFKEVGTYYCAACGNPLFKSDTKFESGCGWPSFYEPISKGSIIYTPDNTLGMKRTEVQCGRCKGHLGHVFDDGPPPTGLRYCINGVVLDFEKAQAAQDKYDAKKASQ